MYLKFTKNKLVIKKHYLVKNKNLAIFFLVEGLNRLVCEVVHIQLIILSRTNKQTR